VSVKHSTAEFVDFDVRATPAVARDLALTVLADQGFRVGRRGEWDATAERGSKAMTNAIGFLGVAYLRIELSVMGGPEGQAVVRLQRETKGYAKGGGAVRRGRASSLFDGAVDALSRAFTKHGILLASRQERGPS
jgi:hypothetical protein